MYEELIERLREYPDREETAGGYVEIDWQDLLDAADAVESLTDQLAALQAENGELREENGCLQHNVAAMEARLDQQAKNCEELLAEKDKEIWRLRKELTQAHTMETLMDYNQDFLRSEVKRLEAERDAVKRTLDGICSQIDNDCWLRKQFCENGDSDLEPCLCPSLREHSGYIDSDDCEGCDFFVNSWRSAQGEA